VTRRSYEQPCSAARALDRIGERWALLIVRELSLGPLRFSDLVQSIGGAPTDVLTRRLRDLEDDGIVSRRELGPPASAVVYELTELGQGLEQPLIELGRWGLNFQRAADAAAIDPGWLPNALRVMLQPPPEASLTLRLDSGGQTFRLRIEDGWIAAHRGDDAGDDPDLAISGTPAEVLGVLVGIDPDRTGIVVDGDPAGLESLLSMVVVPDRLRAEALAEFGGELPPAATARTA
jgi:DNA-binding HxlR family transcriptional regulator